EEERRLFYVGLTRAKQRLLLTSSGERPWAGPSPRHLSRFIADIPRTLVRDADAGPVKRAKKPGNAGQMELF
ncbi:MAG TPA: 3'-5' exonuclease, partial [Desulfuromonadaceae bacterium]